ncbi:MAG TPA: immunoglobulin-like domain-containing protein [Acidobacteriota bacterium]|nr:immunoglobulin-like domain-containing protein [Acidobacteriota bacterium]
MLLSIRRLALMTALIVLCLLQLFLLAADQTRNANGHTVDNPNEWIATGNIEGAPDDFCAATSDVPMDNWIEVTFPAFTIPAGEMITGVEVRVKYRTNGDNQVQLTIGGSLSGSAMVLPLFFGGQSNCASTSFVSAGGDGNLWGISEASLRTAATNGTLGFRLTQVNGPTLDIDAVELIVYFTEPNTPPVAMCQDVQEVADAQCQATVTAAQVDDGSFDPDGDPITLSLSPSGPFSLGDTPVTLTVTDDSNAEDMCPATVTVVDETAPVISLVDGDLTLECGVDTFVDPGFSASDNCDNDVPVTVGGDTVDTSTPGVYVITYDAVDDSGNNAVQRTRTVTVADTIPPVITLNGDAEITLECNVDTFTDPGATATDICDGSVPVTVSGDTVDTSTPGTYIILYDAADTAGNNAVQVSRTVIVQDTLPPVISCNAPATITPPDAPISFTASAEDACEGTVAAEVTSFDCYWTNPSGKLVDKTNSCVVSFEGDTLTIEDSGGVHDTIEWTVTAEDTFGNMASETCSVAVVNPAQSLEALDLEHRLDFAQFSSGQGLRSQMILHNPSQTRTVSGFVRLLDAQGQPWQSLPRINGQQVEAAGDWSAVYFSIAPLGDFALEGPQAAQLRSGSATVQSDGRLAGIVRFTIEGLGTAVVPGSQPMSEALASVRRQAGSNTGAAVRNTEDHPITLSLTLRDPLGQPLEGGFTTLSLPAQGRSALLLDELFGDAVPPFFQGELEIRSQDGSFVATVLEFGAEPGSFTALPVTPLEGDEPETQNPEDQNQQ